MKHLSDRPARQEAGAPGARRDTSDALEADERGRILHLMQLDLQTLGFLISHGWSFEYLIQRWAELLTAAGHSRCRQIN